MIGALYEHTANGQTANKHDAYCPKKTLLCLQLMHFFGILNIKPELKKHIVKNVFPWCLSLAQGI